MFPFVLISLSLAPAHADELRVQWLDVPKIVTPAARVLVVTEPGGGPFARAFAAELQRWHGGGGGGYTFRDVPFPPSEVVTATVNAPLTPTTAAALARKEHADLVVRGVGSVSAGPVAESTEKRDVVVKTANGEEKRKVDVPCAEREVTTTLGWTLYAADGKVLAGGGDLVTERTDRDCDEGENDALRLPEPDAGLSKRIQDFAGNTVETFRPRYVSRSLPVVGTTRSRDALRLLMAADVDGAATALTTALSGTPYDPGLVHLGAVIAYTRGQRDDALALEAFAQQLGPAAPAPALAAAFDAQAEARQRMLDAYGGQAAPLGDAVLAPLVERARAAATLTPLAGEPSQIQLGRNATLPLLSSPDKKAAEGVQVTDGTRVYADGADARFVHVRLPEGDAEGWIPKSHVKPLEAR